MSGHAAAKPGIVALLFHGLSVEHHREPSHRLGIRERLFAVAAWEETPYFTDAERAANARAEAATRLADRADPVPDPIWGPLRSTTTSGSWPRSFSGSRRRTSSTI